MEDVLNNRVRMINGLTEFVDADTAPYAGISQFPTVIGGVKTKMTIVNGLNQIASGTSKGIKVDVNNVRVSMEKLADKVAKGTFAFASANNNNELKATVNWTEAKLHKLQKEDVDDKCEAIFNAANANAAALVAYGIVAGDLTALSAAIALYRPLTGKTRMAQVNINSAKSQMQEIVSGIISFELKAQADPMIGTLKTSNKPYHDQYFNMREILDLGSTTAKVRGTCRDENTDAFLNGVVFNMYRVGEAEVYKTTVSKDKGGFGIYDVAAGDYDLEWVLTGYMTQIEGGVHIAAGKEIKRKSVKMKPGTGTRGSRAVVN